MKERLRETHGRVFELFRHFLLRFFDSDLITSTEHTPTALVGALSVVMQWMFLFVQPLKMKYEGLSRMPAPGPYREALRADELWLVTLTMSAIGLLTAVKWQSLFPTLRDHCALASLPLRPRQLFAAKLMALLTISAAAIVALNLLPAFGFAGVCAGRWAFQRSAGALGLAIFVACAAGAYFLFFGLTGLQGLLLNLLSPRRFGRITGSLQGLLVASMLLLLVLSFSIGPRTADVLIQPAVARWLPPVWFLGLSQSLAGNPDPEMQVLARRASSALVIAIGLTLALYALTYRRYRALLVEGFSDRSSGRRGTGHVLDWILPNPRQEAVVSFMLKTLAKSGQHRTILAAYCGFGFAVLLTGMMGVGKLFPSERVPSACFVYSHVILMVILLAGVRHLFSLPTELGANWTFRIVEREGRQDWMRAVERLVLSSGAAALLVLPLPLEVRFLGWRAVPELLLFTALAMLCYEWAFCSWEKLPFTCSYLPGKTPAWTVALELLGLLITLPAICGAMVVCLYNPLAFVPAMVAIVAAWMHVHAERSGNWGRLPLKWEELPDPAIQGLDLLK
jgi:hypothetical protein